MALLQTKICSKCGNECFNTSPWCKICVREYNKAYNKKHKEREKERNAVYYELHKEEIKTCVRNYRAINKEKAKAADKKYRITHKKESKAWHKAYRKTHRKELKASSKIYRETHRKERNAWHKERCKTDPKFKLNHNVSSTISEILKGIKNGRSWELLVGYTIETLKKHLEKQFAEGMSWENYGRNGWHLEHKIPVSVFNFTKPEHRDFKRCWALSNLQPMWALDNLKKGTNIEKHFQPSLPI